MPIIKTFWVLTILLILMACMPQSKQKATSLETPTADFSPALPVESKQIAPFETSLAISLNPTTLTPKEYTPTPDPMLTRQPPNSEALVQQAIRDLAHRLGIFPSSIELISSSLTEMAYQDVGCELPKGTERFTLPAVRLVFEIILQVGDKQYRYLAWGPRLLFCGEYP